MISLGPIRRPHAAVARHCRWWAGRAASVKRRAASPLTPAKGRQDALALRIEVPTGLSAARDQLMPSITAVIAAPRTAIVAASTVTAAAKQRSRRSQRPRAAGPRGSLVAFRAASSILLAWALRQVRAP